MNNNAKKNIIVFSVIGLFLITTGTFAYFRGSDSYSVKGQAINWTFKAENKNSKETFVKELGDVVPGSSGSFTINLDPSGTNTNVECSISPNVNNALAGMKLYSDEAHTAANEITTENPLKVNLTANSSAQNVTIYWVWEYDTGLLSNQTVTFSINVVGRQIAS